MESVIQKQWEERDNKLYKAMIFKDFQEAFTFIIRLAFLAEKNNHHPRWTNEFNKVEICLCTHELGDIITDKDLAMAKEIDAILSVDGPEDG